jgi:hypothetical protein
MGVTEKSQMGPIQAMAASVPEIMIPHRIYIFCVRHTIFETKKHMTIYTNTFRNTIRLDVTVCTTSNLP